jgi:hypothetical protein
MNRCRLMHPVRLGRPRFYLDLVTHVNRYEDIGSLLREVLSDIRGLASSPAFAVIAQASPSPRQVADEKFYILSCAAIYPCAVIRVNVCVEVCGD